MKKLLLLFAVLALCACSDKDVAAISTVETQNAYLIQVVHEDSLPAVNVVARMRSANFVRSVEEDSAGADYYEEFVTDSLGYIRIDSLAVDTATIEILERGEGLFRKIFAEDLREFGDLRFVMEKVGGLRGRVYLPEGVDYAWVQVYGSDRLVKTDVDGFYEMDSLPPYEYDLRVIVGDSVINEYAEVMPGKETSANVLAFEPDSVKVLDFESADAQFVIEELGISKAGYMSATDSGVKVTPEVKTVPETREDIAEFIVEAGAGREGNAIHWQSSAKRGNWSFYGIWVCEEKSPCDLSATDSIVFYARGNGVISFAFETLGDSHEQGKTLAYDTLDTDKWERRVIKPANFKPRDDMYGNLGWDVISKAVTTISIAAYDDTEFWIDDVSLYGVKPSNFATK